MPTVEIVKLKPEYEELLIHFFKKINSPEYTENFAPHPFNTEYAKLVCNYTGDDLYYSILIDEKEIIGYGMLRGWDEGHEIPSVGLCILKKYQGMRFGKVLLYFLETLSILEGCPKVMVKVKKNNTKARELYRRQEYVLKDYDEDFLIGYKTLNAIDK